MIENLFVLNIIFSFCAGVIALIVYDSKSAFIWGYFAYILPELPKVLRLFEVNNLYTLLVFSHTAGVFLWPILLVMANALLVSLGIIKRTSPFHILLPDWIKHAVFAEKITGYLQRYHIIPRPLRMRDVYLIGVIGGGINLMFWITTGFL